MLSDRLGRKPDPRFKDVVNQLATAPAEPCPRCGVRADVGCRHQPPDGRPPPAMDPGAAKPKRDGRSRPVTAQGLNFHPITREEVEAAARGLSTLPREA